MGNKNVLYGIIALVVVVAAAAYFFVGGDTSAASVTSAPSLSQPVSEVSLALHYHVVGR